MLLFSLLNCDPVNSSPPGASVHGFSRRKQWSELPFPSQGIFLIQGSNLRLLPWQVDSLSWSHQESPTDIDMWIYFWALCSAPLVPVFMPVPSCFASVASQCSWKSGSKVDSSCVLSQNGFDYLRSILATERTLCSVFVRNAIFILFKIEYIQCFGWVNFLLKIFFFF